jgi:hypothetical protein
MSSPTHFEGQWCLMAYRMSESETHAKDKESEDREVVEESHR